MGVPCSQCPSMTWKFTLVTAIETFPYMYTDYVPQDSNSPHDTKGGVVEAESDTARARYHESNDPVLPPIEIAPPCAYASTSFNGRKKAA